MLHVVCAADLWFLGFSVLSIPFLLHTELLREASVLSSGYGIPRGTPWLSKLLSILLHMETVQCPPHTSCQIAWYLEPLSTQICHTPL